MKATITTLRVAVARALNELAHVPPAGATVVVAVSGGVDSMVLWDVLAAEARWHLLIYHLDHGLRPEASADLVLIQAQAKKTKAVQVIGEQADITALSRTWHCSLETAGRRYRYQRLMTIAAEHGANVVMTGHHLDDQAETVLANLLRGAGPMGRAGMPPERRLAPGIHLARPLLQVRRADIVAYARAADIPWLEDHTNRDEQFSRNRLRHAILPTFELGAPGIIAALASLAHTAQTEVSAYEVAVAKVWSERGSESIPLTEVVTWPADVRLHLWRKLSDTLGIAIQRNGLRRIDQLALGLVGQRVHAGEWMLLKRRDRLTWARATPIPDNMSKTISQAGTYVRGSECLIISAASVPEKFQHDPDHAVIDADQAHFPWTWRYPHADERFVPLGGPGNQTVVKHLANRGVASQYRALTPVLADVSGIIWIPGFTIAQRVRVLPTTVHTWAIQRSQSEP